MVLNMNSYLQREGKMHKDLMFLNISLHVKIGLTVISFCVYDEIVALKLS